MTMAAAGPVRAPAHGKVTFAPDGLHVMLIGLKAPLLDGRVQPMTLHFASAGAITVPFAVRARIETGGAGATMGGGMQGMPGM